jgi:hypothetical protein
MALEMSPLRMNDELLRLGNSLVARLFVLFKTAQNYSESHGAVDAPVDGVIEAVREIQGKNEEAALRVKGNYLYLGELRLKPAASGFHAFGFVREELTRQGVGGICFNRPASHQDLRRLAYVFEEVESQPGADRYLEILKRVQQRMIAGIDLETLPKEPDRPRIVVDRDLKDARFRARRLFLQAVEALDQVLDNAAEGKPLRLRDSKRVVQQVIDLLPSTEASLLGHALGRRPAPRCGDHGARVCILSLALGRRLGMSKLALGELGMAALLHDIGCAGLPAEALPACLSAGDRQLLEAHPLLGVKMIMQQHGLDTLSSRIITGVFEHHLLADSSGYPRVAYPGPGLLGRIISIADGYDVLTSARLGGGCPFPPEQGVRYLFTQAGKAYDQALLKAFLGVVGLHPIGTLLQLDSRELAVVVGHSPDPARWSQPRVRIIADPGGREVDGEVVDLAESAPPRGVSGALDPRRYRLDVSRYLP